MLQHVTQVDVVEALRRQLGALQLTEVHFNLVVLLRRLDRRRAEIDSGDIPAKYRESGKKGGVAAADVESPTPGRGRRYVVTTVESSSLDPGESPMREEPEGKRGGKITVAKLCQDGSSQFETLLRCRLWVR
jgi:hypothetical protein